jgi:hypothetical protein
VVVVPLDDDDYAYGFKNGEPFALPVSESDSEEDEEEEEDEARNDMVEAEGRG